jgi:phosphoribosylformylglycinamidine synthase
MTVLQATSYKPKALVFAGYGLNCEEETKFAFDRAGAEAEIVHINDLIEKPELLNDFQIAAMPGGFSYGDDLGSGRAYGLRVKNHLQRELSKFLQRDTLMIGICNGFQILTAAGILPGALLDNSGARYVDRWVDVRVTGDSPWLFGLESLMLPIAHGEGRYHLPKQELKTLREEGRIALKYEKGEVSKHLDLQANPNGSIENIAGITGCRGRVLGLMPHPERAQFFTQLPHWPFLKQQYQRSGREIPKDGPGLAVFKNAVKYFV